MSAAVPADERDVRRRCTAKARTTGDRCGNYAIIGHHVCRMHGGSAPQVRRSARLRLAGAADAAIDVLIGVVEGHDWTADAGHRIRAAEAILDRAGYPRRTEVDLSDARAMLEDRLAAAEAGT